jgi:hypothetical protein
VAIEGRSEYEPMDFDEIADRWGGVGCKRLPTTNSKDPAKFLGDEGYSRYVVWLPGSQAALAEIDGRPFRSRVPRGFYLVRCLDDAPDCWWLVPVKGAK